ncbi:flavin-containing monooxygenase FMO GS-OX-like 4 [Polyodon spathula]|uniref:flavin-containing monooxygenase FMO GS-OX-like 4 n=1 Tax=Polyodon spathula TaxID=7913 RepID=UPI001B7E6DC6|nr:flavin-containing monooxygenase FMO GS-OX-like 4 [Polyodon spathula]
MRSGKLRVAVIGAGAAGLCAARHVLARGGSFSPPTVFELSERVGGTWVYEERVGKDQRGRTVHSSMYRDLRTNIPKEVMAFPDFPFEKRLPSFVHHSEVRRYLEQYCQHYRLREHIQFGTSVESVKPVATEKGWRGLAWDVTTSDVTGTKDTTTERFDAVMVCNGHFFDPYIPPIPGLENFKGTLMHSHDYRCPEPFAGQSVLLLGAGLSGLDIAQELSAVTRPVTLSHSQPPLRSPLPRGMLEAPGVQRVRGDGALELGDGSLVRPDVFMFCTGYKFTFPFLEPGELGLQLRSHMVSPLYKHLLHTAFPSLSIVGLCRAICPFPHFHCQTQFALSVLDGSFTLPSREQMDREVDTEIRRLLDSGVPLRHVLKLDAEQWDYNDHLAALGNFPALPPYWRSLYQANKEFRATDLLNYKRYSYQVLSDTDWSVERHPH